MMPQVDLFLFVEEIEDTNDQKDILKLTDLQHVFVTHNLFKGFGFLSASLFVTFQKLQSNPIQKVSMNQQKSVVAW